MQVNEGANKKGKRPFWVVFPWLFLVYVNVLGAGYILAWWFDLIDPAGGSEGVLGLLIAWGVLSIFLLIVAVSITLFWRSRRPPTKTS